MSKQKLFLTFLLLFFLASAGLVSADVTRSATQYQYNNNLTDMGYNGFDASFAGSGGTYVSGHLSNAFDTEGTACSVASSETLNATGNHDLTVAFWIYLPVGASNGEFLYEIGTTGTGSYFAEIDVNENIGTYIGSGGGYATSGSVALTTWTHYLTTYHATNRTTCVYLNGVLDGCNAHSKDLNHPTGANSDFVIGGVNTGCSGPTDAYFDDWRYYEEALNGSQIAEIYNSGTGTEDNPIGAAPPTPSANLSLTITDAWDGGAVNNVSAQLLGDTYSNTTGNIIYTAISQNASIITQINYTGENYFSKTTSQNISSNVAETLYQSEIHFNASEVFSGAAVSPATFTISANTDNPKYLKAGSYNVTANATGYFSATQQFSVSALDNTTISVSNMSQATIILNATNVFTGAVLNNISGWVYNQEYGVNLSFSNATGNQTYIPAIVGNYTIYLEAEGYAIGPDSNYDTVELTGNSYNKTFLLYTENSVNINIYDADSLALITDNMTVVISGNTSEDTYTTITGNIYVDNLSDGEYVVKISGTNYSLTTYGLTVSTRSTQTLNAYLSANTQEVVFTIKDFDSKQEIEGVSMTMSRLINGSWTVVESGTSDITGRIQYNYLPTVAYRFVTSYPNYQEKIFTLDPILFTTYNVLIEKTTSLQSDLDYTGVVVEWAPKAFSENVTSNFTWLITSPAGLLENYNLTINSTNGTYIFSGTSANGGQFTQNMSFYNVDILDQVTIDYCYEITIGIPRCFRYSYYITPDSGSTSWINLAKNTYGLGLLERIIIATIIIIVIVGVVSLFANFIAGIGLAILLWALFSFTGFIPLWAIVPSIIIGLMLLWGRSA